METKVVKCGGIMENVNFSKASDLQDFDLRHQGTSLETIKEFSQVQLVSNVFFEKKMCGKEYSVEDLIENFWEIDLNLKENKHVKENKKINVELKIVKNDSVFSYKMFAYGEIIEELLNNISDIETYKGKVLEDVIKEVVFYSNHYKNVRQPNEHYYYGEKITNDWYFGVIKEIKFK